MKYRNFTIETDPLTSNLNSKYLVKAIFFITPSNTHKIADMSSSYSTVLWASLFQKLFSYQFKIAFLYLNF